MARAFPDDIEASLSKLRAGSKLELRLWLRMLACVNLASAEIRRRLRQQFEVTLPQFDVLAQLQREPEGLKLGELSRRLMVTKGNLTGLVDTLVDAGLVSRDAVHGDRRARNIKLTKAGAVFFGQLAAEHEAWLGAFFGDLEKDTLISLIEELDQVKRSIRGAVNRSR